MKRKIIVALLLILTMICSLFAFTGCGDKESGEKQVPVYQGMTITKSNSVLSLASYRMSGITLLSANNENNGDNGNHNGHYKGDHTDRNDTIDEDNPYPDNNANENIYSSSNPLDMKLLYVAVTRAKKLLIVVGSKNVLEQMASNDRKTLRYTALKALLG